GQEFFMGSRKLRCTDVGSRTVAAICVDLPHEVVHSWQDADGWHQKREMTDDPSWFNGPPYAVVEEVLDEYDIAACHRTLDEKPDGIPVQGSRWKRRIDREAR